MNHYWAFYQDLILNLTDGIFLVGTDTTITLWNRGAELITGYSADEALGRKCSEIFACESFSGRVLCSICPFVKQSLQSGVVTKLAPVFIRNKSGQRIQTVTNSYPEVGQNHYVTGAIQVFMYNVEATQHKEKMKSLIRRAFIDSVTGLYNKSYMQGKLEQFMEEYKKTGEGFGLVFINVLQMNRINLAYGESGGDKVLKELTAALVKVAEAEDILGRWHGANFLMIIGTDKKSVLFMYENRIKNAIADLTFSVAEKLVEVKVSVGGTLVRSYDSLYSVLSRAECSVIKEAEEEVEEAAPPVKVQAEEKPAEEAQEMKEPEAVLDEWEKEDPWAEELKEKTAAKVKNILTKDK